MMTLRVSSLLVLLLSSLPVWAEDSSTAAFGLPSPAVDEGRDGAPLRAPLTLEGGSSLPSPADQPSAPMSVPLPSPVEASWYTRVDWFHWNEQAQDIHFVTESGALYTLGYERKIAAERFRAELFGGGVHYDGYGQFPNGDLEPFAATTRYLGARGEYEYLIQPALWEERANLVLGIGSRLWIRDLGSGVGDYGHLISGYQETWWTIYPYLGLEAQRRLDSSLVLYSQARIGATVFTYDRAVICDEPLWPRCGVTSQLEIGLRGKHFFLSGECEVMSFSASPVAQDFYQPSSQMVTVGGRLGFHF
jgi:hypothetical protein